MIQARFCSSWCSVVKNTQSKMVADYNVQLLLGVMECTTEVNADLFFHQRLCLFGSICALRFSLCFQFFTQVQYLF